MARVDYRPVLGRYLIPMKGLFSRWGLGPSRRFRRSIMNLILMRASTLIFVSGLSVLPAGGLAAGPGSALAQAKKEAEAKGFIFETNHDEIVAKARKEGSLKVLSGSDPSIFSSMMESFKKKYPFIKIEMVEITGPDSAQRFVTELKSGSRADFDVAHASTEFYPEYLTFTKTLDMFCIA